MMKRIIGAAAGLAMTIGLVGFATAPAAQAAPKKAKLLTTQQAEAWDIAWWINPTIQSPCTDLYLTSDKRNLVYVRTDTPQEQCGEGIIYLANSAPGTVSVQILNKDGKVIGGGDAIAPGFTTVKQWRTNLKKSIKPSKAAMRQIMSLSKPYLA